MLILVSGEGATDIGTCIIGETCEGEDFQPGPMAWLIDQIAARQLGDSFIAAGRMRCMAKASLVNAAKNLPSLSKKAKTRGLATLPGRKRPPETMYFYNNARALARAAQSLAGETECMVVAVLFRDADRTRSAARGERQDKVKSVVHGFMIEGFESGVPMVPNPKSEAWLLCALKTNQPYQHCHALESASGNDDSPHDLKQQLETAIGQEPTGLLLATLVRQGRVDSARIAMPSFLEFRERLIQVLS